MTSEEFWDLHNNNSILDNYEKLVEFFSGDLPQDFINDEDHLDIIMEIVHSLEVSKDYEKLILFIEMLQSRHPDIYLEVFESTDSLPIHYYCFHQQYEKLEGPITRFSENPDRDPEIFTAILQKLLFSDLKDYAARMVTPAVYEKLEEIEDEEELEELDNEISNLAYYFELEKQYVFSKPSGINLDELNKKLDPYELYFSKKHVSLIEKGFSASSLSAEKMFKTFPEEQEDFLLCLQFVFIKHMYDKGMSFAISAAIWDLIEEYWDEFNNDNCNLNARPDFTFDTRNLTSFLESKINGLFLEIVPQEPALIWGSAYVYEFLLSKGFIDENAYQHFLAGQKEAKAEFITENIKELWTFSFVHQWPKPESLSQSALRAEKSLFEKSYSIKGNDFEDYKEALSNELNELGDIKQLIEKYEEELENEDNLLLKHFEKLRGEPGRGKENDTFPHFYQPTAPIVKDQKIGRNDPCPCGSGKKHKKCCGD